MNKTMGEDSVFIQEATEESGRIDASVAPQDPHHLSPESLPGAVLVEVGRKQLESSSSLGVAACRICHSGEQSAPFPPKKGVGESLISPCRCSGTMGLYHRSCLERWLSTSQTDKCEICKFRYRVAKRPQAFRVVLAGDSEEAVTERRNLAGDVLCCALMSPLAIVIAFLCFQGGLHYWRRGGASYESPGLFAVASLLLATWLLWIVVAAAYHCRLARRWRRLHLQVQLLSSPNRPRSPRGLRPSPLPLASLHESPARVAETDVDQPTSATSSSWTLLTTSRHLPSSSHCHRDSPLLSPPQATSSPLSYNPNNNVHDA